MILKQFFDISTSFRFSKMQWGSVPSIPVAVLVRTKVWIYMKVLGPIQSVTNQVDKSQEFIVYNFFIHKRKNWKFGFEKTKWLLIPESLLMRFFPMLFLKLSILQHWDDHLAIEKSWKVFHWLQILFQDEKLYLFAECNACFM